eukprot:215454_1
MAGTFTHIINIGAGAIATIAQITIIIYHYQMTQKHEPSFTQYSNIKKQLSLYCSFLLMIFGLCFIISQFIQTIIQLRPVSTIQCLANVMVNVPFLILFKVTLYNVLILRVYESYHGSLMITYSKRMLFILIAIFTFWALINMVGIYTQLQTVYARNGECIYEFPKYLLASQGLMDFVACAIITFLFVKPIFLLNNNKDNNTAKELKYVAIKQCILTGISSCLTIITLVLAGSVASFIELWTTIDTVISSFCIILMYKFYSDLAFKLFGVFCCCWKDAIEYKENIENMETTMQPTISSISTDTSAVSVGATVQAEHVTNSEIIQNKQTDVDTL